MTTGSGTGRPRENRLTGEDAELIRSAVRAATRYFGIAVSDLDSGATWVANAMRRDSPMMASTAERLFLLIQRPDVSLVGRKKPQGPSLRETQDAIAQHTADPAGYPLPQTPTMEYISLVFVAGRTVERYTRPMPGSVLFALPNSAQAIAESLADEIIDEGVFGRVGRSRRLKLTKFLTFYFEIAEQPLKTESAKEILGALNGLGIAHVLNTGAQLNEAYPESPPFDASPIAEALLEAETRREAILSEKSQKRPTRKKRNVTMPRIRRLVS